MKSVFENNTLVRMARVTFQNCMLYMAIVLLLTSCGSSTGTTWQEQYDLGMQYLTDGDYEAAIVAFTAAIEIDAKDIQAYTGLVQAYIGRGDYESAAATAEQGAGVLYDSDQAQETGAVDDFTTTLLTLGEVCLEDEMYETAETIYSLLIGIDENLVNAYIGRAEMYILLGEREKALEDYRKALELLQQGQIGSITEDELESLIAGIENSYMDDASAETETAKDNYVLAEEYYVYADGTQRLACEYTHDESGTILTKTTYELGPDGTYVTEYFYTEDNEELPLTLHVVDNDETVWSKEYVYDDEGKLTTAITYTEDEKTDRTEYTYDEYGNIITEYWYYMDEIHLSYEYQYTYDMNGNVLDKIVIYSLTGLGEYSYIYDNNGNLTSDIYKQYSDGQAIWSSENIHTYDDKGNVLSILYTSYDAEGQVSNQSGTYYTYDEVGNVLSMYFDYDQTMYEYVYDDGKMISETLYKDGEAVTRTEYAYDAVGNIITETCYSNDVTLRYVHSYIYEVISK